MEGPRTALTFVSNNYILCYCVLCVSFTVHTYIYIKNGCREREREGGALLILCLLSFCCKDLLIIHAQENQRFLPPQPT